jgi:SOS-response transcriptional repressor LexA
MSGQPADLVKGKMVSQLAKLKGEAERLSDFLNRVEQRRQQLGFSERRAAVEAGLSPSQIRTMRRQWREGKQRGVSVRTVAGLARALHTTPGWLITGTDPEEVIAEALRGPGAIAGLRLVGAVGAGLWLEVASENSDAQFVRVPPDPRYPADYQSAYEVRGTSTDRFARPGDYLIVVDRAAASLPVRSGDIVIVTRDRDGLREVTARRFQGSAPNCELRFDSTDPRYGGSPILMRDPETADITLGGIVVGVYRPLV